MAASERRQRERAARHRLILDTARAIADAEGWDAVTTRRLADQVEYSQPVLYSHFAGKDAIIAAVALEGFTELAAKLGTATDAAAMAATYLDFAREHPAVYDAMFAEPTTLIFATGDIPPPLREGFRAVVHFAGGDETRAEVLWSALHGLATLERGHRLRPDQAGARLAVVIAALTGP